MLFRTFTRIVNYHSIYKKRTEMKKAFLSLLLALPFVEASAQYKMQFSPVEASMPIPVIRHHDNYVPTPLYDEPIAAKGASNSGPRWYNHAQSLAAYYGVSQTQLYSSKNTTALAIWQDSSVHYTGTSSNRGIGWLSAAELFAPNTQLYNVNTTTPVNNRGKLQVKSESYKVDSVIVRGFYTRTATSTYIDTLILTFVSDSTAGTFATDGYGGTTLADHGIDTFGLLLWRSSDYLVNPINQISYTYTEGTATRYLKYWGQIKVPLTQTTATDTLSDGSSLIKAAVGITIPGSTKSTGGRVSMSVTFKSGTTYVAGDPITNYNFFALMSHETDSGQFQQYPPTDQNMSYLVKSDSTNSKVNATLNLYIPTIAFSSPAFDVEVHDISWKISCTTCANVGVNDVENVAIGHAYPNPANNTINIPVSVRTAASVNVSISNLLGQVLKTQSFNMGAGQGKTATFNTSDLANGVYIYTVESDGSRSSNRILVTH
jgi:hypothetical protein